MPPCARTSGQAADDGRGVPFPVINRRNALQGAQPPEDLAEALRMVLDESVLPAGC